jgi:hypothetical protein
MHSTTKQILYEKDFLDSQGNQIREGFYKDPENTDIAIYLNPSFSKVHNQWLGCNMHHRPISCSAQDTRALVPFPEEEIAKISKEYIKSDRLHERSDILSQYSEVNRINNIIQKRKTDPNYKKGLVSHMNLP